MSALSQHKSWNHEIPLISEISSKIRPICLLFYTQLKTLRQYLNKNLKKGFTQKIKILAEFLILFVSKKEG